MHPTYPPVHPAYPGMHQPSMSLPPAVTPREMAYLVNEMAASDYYRSPRYAHPHPTRPQ